MLSQNKSGRRVVADMRLLIQGQGNLRRRPLSDVAEQDRQSRYPRIPGSVPDRLTFGGPNLENLHLAAMGELSPGIARFPATIPCRPASRSGQASLASALCLRFAGLMTGNRGATVRRLNP